MIPLEIIPTAEDGSNLRDSREEYAKKVQIGELTPEGYCDSIRGYTSQNIHNSLYPGDDFTSFESFLRPGRSGVIAPSDMSNFVTLYRFSSNGNREVTPIVSVEGLEAVVKDVGAKATANENSKTSAMLFLNGYPSPECIATLGATLKVDPSFFRKHMELPSSFKRQPTFAFPSLPSASDNVIRLRFISIGSRSSKKELGQKEVDKLREKAQEEMEDYYVDLGSKKRTNPGDPIVRAYHVHDNRHFSIEQDVSICNLKIGQSWINLVWLDSGSDLSKGPSGPWLEATADAGTWESAFLPTIRHLPNIALNWRSLALSSDNHLNGKFDQSASLLHRDYGKSLDKELMATDPFYALHELYSFSAHSTCQFLNLVDSIIMAETGYQSKHDHQFSHATLQYHQDILAQQSRVLRGTIRSIKRSSFWTELGLSVVTESLKPQKTTLVTCRTSLLADFEELLERTELLVNRCARGMGAIMNQAMLGESQRAISQAKKIEQLSFLATFYIPLSFTTSFFGMNLGVVGKGGLPLWLWFAISFPVLLLSYGSLQFLMYVNLKI